MLVALPLPHRAFNGKPQSLEFGLMFQSAYIFFANVVLEALRLFRQGLFGLRLTIPRL